MKNPATASWPAFQTELILWPGNIMKNKEQTLGSRLRWIFRRRMRQHDPMLVLNMSFFNYTDGWGRIFSKNDYGRFES